MAPKTRQGIFVENSVFPPETWEQAVVRSSSPTMRSVEQVISEIAPTDLPVLIVGESGSGKEAVALTIHRLSRRSEFPFLKVVCGALAPEEFDSLVVDGPGEKDNGPNGSALMGTLFLDEVAELSPHCQAKLLHVFPDGDLVAPLRFLSARIISASTHTPEELEEGARGGGFRKELYYRLKGVCLRLPPLRDRKEDIPALVEFFLRKNSAQLGRPQPSLSVQALHVLIEYSWPGNIRELENTVKKIVALGNDGTAIADLSPSALRTHAPNVDAERVSLKQTSREASRTAERELILKVLARTHWNRKRAAQQLQISYKALLYKLRQMGLDDAGES